MRLPDGPQAGQSWIPESEPLQAQCLHEFANGGRSKIVLVWPSQRGKTLCGILAPVLHAVAEHRSSVGYLMPSLDKLSQNWEGKIKPAIEGAGYKDWLPTKGPGSRGGRPAALTMRDPTSGLVAGRIYFMALGGGGKETAISSVSPRVVAVDEADDAEDEGQLGLAFKRIAAYGSAGRAYVVSTVNARRDRKGHPVLDLAARGTMSRLYHQCPHCQDMAPITRARFVGGAINCEKCGAMWSTEDSIKALRAAKLTHQFPDRDILSVIAVGPDFFMGGGLAEIEKQRADAQEAIDLRGDHSLMRLYFHKVWCEDYTGDVIKDDEGQTVIPTRNRLAALASQSHVLLDVDRREKDGDSVHLVHLPDEIEHQTIGVDVQRGGENAPPRLYFVLLGRAPAKGKTWITGWGTIAIGPVGRQATDGEIMEALDRLRNLLDDWKPKAPIVRRLIDINDGGWMSDKRAANAAVLRWLRQNPSWWGIRGSPAIKPDTGDIPDWIYHRTEGTTKIRHVCTSNAIRTIHGEIISGSMILPHALSVKADNNRHQSIVLHFCATVEYQPGKWSEGDRDRKHHPEWQKRHDYLDAAAYARAGLKDWESRPRAPAGVSQPGQKSRVVRGPDGYAQVVPV